MAIEDNRRGMLLFGPLRFGFYVLGALLVLATGVETAECAEPTPLAKSESVIKPESDAKPGSVAKPVPEAKPVSVAKVVREVCVKNPGYRDGDLLTQSDFDQIIQHLESTGAPVDRFAPLRERIPDSSSSIQKLNATQQGKMFLRKVSGVRGGYATVEDLAGRPDGKQTLHQLSRDRGGYKMIEYMATTNGGQQMMRQTPSTPKPDVAPPEPIYTAKDLLNAMKTAHNAASK